MTAFDATPWTCAAAKAAAQWSNLTRADLLRCGSSRHEIDRAVRTGRLFREHHGVYALGKPATTPHERAMAAVLAGGPHALLCELWALWLWDLGRLPRSPITIAAPPSRRSTAGYEVRRTRNLERDCNYGIPVTAPARTLADCAPLLTPKQLRRAVNQAQLDHRTQREHLLAQPRLRDLVTAHGATRSILEDLLFELSRAHGLPEPRLNAEVHGVEVDFFYPDRNLVIEADGWSFHWTKVTFEDDHERRLHLEERGVRVVAVTYAQVKRRGIAARLERIIATTSGTPVARR